MRYWIMTAAQKTYPGTFGDTFILRKKLNGHQFRTMCIYFNLFIERNTALLDLELRRFFGRSFSGNSRDVLKYVLIFSFIGPAIVNCLRILMVVLKLFFFLMHVNVRVVYLCFFTKVREILMRYHSLICY